MADALLSTPVAVAADVVAAALITIAGKKVSKSSRENIVPLMGVLGACVFAAQMVNFTIPGTGSSGHIIGGVFLSALIGPWAAFLTIASVLIVQCLVFADGGLLALGCNIINMGAMSCLVAYPLIFAPLRKHGLSTSRIFLASILTCVVALEAGAVLVTIETTVSGVSALSTLQFLSLMTAIHLAIGVGEGLATGAILSFIAKARPDMLSEQSLQTPLESSQEVNSETSLETSLEFSSEASLRVGETAKKKRSLWPVIGGFAAAALIIGGGLSFLASENPDGLEWSIAKVVGDTELESSDTFVQAASNVQQATAFMPDYQNTFSGIVGTVMVLVLLWVICSVVRAKKKSEATAQAGGENQNQRE